MSGLDPASPPGFPHIYNRPDLPLGRVLAVGVYASCAGGPALSQEDAKQKCGFLLERCKEFHERELPGSKADYCLHSIELPFAASDFDDDPNGFYSSLLEAVESRAKQSGGLGERLLERLALSKSEDDDTDDKDDRLKHRQQYDHVSFVVFADWGQEDLGKKGRAALEKYYCFGGAAVVMERKRQQQQVAASVAGPGSSSTTAATGTPAPRPSGAKPGSKAEKAAAAATHEYLLRSGITRTGGSRSCFFGQKRLSDLLAVLPPSKLANEKEKEKEKKKEKGEKEGLQTITVTTHSKASRTFHLSLLPSPADDPVVSWGLGMVTQEAFYCPEIPGSECVTYHEGLGHSLNMPHPTALDYDDDDYDDGYEGSSGDEREAADTCVMGRGQYQHKTLMEIFLCDEIKRGMFTTAGASPTPTPAPSPTTTAARFVASIPLSFLGGAIARCGGPVARSQQLAICSLAGRLKEEKIEGSQTSFASVVEQRAAEGVLRSAGGSGGSGGSGGVRLCFLCDRTSEGSFHGAKQLTMIMRDGAISVPLAASPSPSSSSSSPPVPLTTSSPTIPAALDKLERFFRTGKNERGETLSFNDLLALTTVETPATAAATATPATSFCVNWPERQLVPLFQPSDVVDAAADALRSPSSSSSIPSPSPSPSSPGDVDGGVLLLSQVAHYSWQEVKAAADGTATAAITSSTLASSSSSSSSAVFVPVDELVAAVAASTSAHRDPDPDSDSDSDSSSGSGSGSGSIAIAGALNARGCVFLYDASRDFKAVLMGPFIFLSCARSSSKKGSKELKELFEGPYWGLYSGKWVVAAAATAAEA